MHATALVVEPDEGVLETLSKWLTDLGYAVATAKDAASAREALAEGDHDAVFCACALEDDPGHPLLPRLARQLQDCSLFGLGFPTGDGAARALIRSQVFECLRVPLERAEFLLAMERSAVLASGRGTAAQLQRENESQRMRRPLIAASSAMIHLMEEIEGSAALDTPVLVVGEYGVGKESVARMIHAHSSRRQAPFLKVDATQMEEAELESLLVGSLQGSRPPGTRRGGKLLARARGGSLFIESVHQLPTTLRQLLARRLAPQRQPAPGLAFDLRLMASAETIEAPSPPETSDPLSELLVGSVLQVPPLRERREDIPLLVDHFFAASFRQRHSRLPALSGELLTRFSEHPWPGNLRELENVIERSVLAARARGDSANPITTTHLAPPRSPEDESPDQLALRPARKKFERELILRALRASDGNRTHAARKLEISHRALLYKLKSYDISKD